MELRRKEEGVGRREGELTARTMPPIPSPGIMAMRNTVGLTNCILRMGGAERGEEVEEEREGGAHFVESRIETVSRPRRFYAVRRRYESMQDVTVYS